jgi:hypothetical protein
MESLLNNPTTDSLLNNSPSVDYNISVNKYSAKNDDTTSKTVEPIVESISEKPSYEEQGRIVYENYIRNTNQYLSGKDKRRILRECIRNAKKGKYDYMFDPEKQKKRQERAIKNGSFNKLNGPQS